MVLTPQGERKRVVTGEGYYAFMELTRSFIATHYQKLCQIRMALNTGQPYNAQKGLLKIVDEFNTHAVYVPFYCLL